MIAKEILHPCSKCKKEPMIRNVPGTFEFYVECGCGKRTEIMSTPQAAIIEWNEKEGKA